ncbi:hypothetical protein FB451DRAFT_1466054 [Mycena latifolia]|nr:hypothetical protein FB451DRAFT_1466054 [Mycena latifolia]
MPAQSSGRRAFSPVLDTRAHICVLRTRSRGSVRMGDRVSRLGEARAVVTPREHVLAVWYLLPAPHVLLVIGASFQRRPFDGRNDSPLRAQEARIPLGETTSVTTFLSIDFSRLFRHPIYQPCAKRVWGHTSGEVHLQRENNEKSFLQSHFIWLQKHCAQKALSVEIRMAPLLGHIAIQTVGVPLHGDVHGGRRRAPVLAQRAGTTDRSIDREKYAHIHSEISGSTPSFLERRFHSPGKAMSLSAGHTGIRCAPSFTHRTLRIYGFFKTVSAISTEAKKNMRSSRTLRKSPSSRVSQHSTRVWWTLEGLCWARNAQEPRGSLPLPPLAGAECPAVYTPRGTRMAVDPHLGNSTESRSYAAEVGRRFNQESGPPASSPAAGSAGPSEALKYQTEPKTAIAVALSHIFSFAHTQSDDVHAKKAAPVCLKNVQGLLKTHDVVIADKTNHLTQHRTALRTATAALRPPVRLALHWPLDEQPRPAVHRICVDHVQHRRGDLEEGLAAAVRRAADACVRILKLQAPSSARVEDALERVRGYAPRVKKPDAPAGKAKAKPEPRPFTLLPEVALERLLEPVLAAMPFWGAPACDARARERVRRGGCGRRGRRGARAVCGGHAACVGVGRRRGRGPEAGGFGVRCKATGGGARAAAHYGRDANVPPVERKTAVYAWRQTGDVGGVHTIPLQGVLVTGRVKGLQTTISLLREYDIIIIYLGARWRSTPLTILTTSSGQEDIAEHIPRVEGLLDTAYITYICFQSVEERCILWRGKEFE